RGVIRAPAAVGHDGGGQLHDRLPIGVGHVGDQHIALLDAVHLAGTFDDPNDASRCLRVDGTADDQRFAPAPHAVARQHAARAALDCFGPGLDHVDVTVLPVLDPLDVHGTP